jgi:hypothetical protein
MAAMPLLSKDGKKRATASPSKRFFGLTIESYHFVWKTQIMLNTKYSGIASLFADCK